MLGHYDANFEYCEEYVKKICNMVLENDDEKLILNVNFPSGTKKFKGIKICRQAKGYWKDNYDKRISPLGKDYYWLTGNFINQEENDETDEWALKNEYVSIVPVTYDMTCYDQLSKIRNWKIN